MNQTDRTRIRRIIWFTVFGFIAAYGTSSTWVAPAIAKHYMRQALADAAPSDLEKAVGPLGVVLRFKDGDWLAIAYRDDHGLFFGWSRAVARDSHGAWYVSDNHFCGHLRKAIHVDEQGRLRPNWAPPPDPPKRTIEWVCLLGSSRDLTAARKRMTQYFKPLE